MKSIFIYLAMVLASVPCKGQTTDNDFVLNYSNFHPSYKSSQTFKTFYDVVKVAFTENEASILKKFLQDTNAKIIEADPDGELEVGIEIRRIALDELSRTLPGKTYRKLVHASNYVTVDRTLNKSKFDVSGLSTNELKKMLDISQGQSDKIDKITRRTEDKFDELNQVFFIAVAQVYDQRFSALTKVLDSEQRREFTQLIGQPVKFFKHYYARGEASDFFVDPTKVANRRYPEGRKAFDMQLRVLLNSKVAAKELELTSEQVQKIRELSRAIRKDHNVIYNSRRVDDLLAGNAKIPSELSDILIGEQLKIFKQLDFQFTTGQFISSFGLLHPKVVKHLGLSQSQVTEIKNIVKKSELAKGDLEKEYATKTLPEVKSFFDLSLSFLNEKQRKRYNEVLPAQPFWGCVLGKPQKPWNAIPESNVDSSRKADALSIGG